MLLRRPSSNCESGGNCCPDRAPRKRRTSTTTCSESPRSPPPIRTTRDRCPLPKPPTPTALAGCSTRSPIHSAGKPRSATTTSGDAPASPTTKRTKPRTLSTRVRRPQTRFLVILLIWRKVLLPIFAQASKTSAATYSCLDTHSLARPVRLPQSGGMTNNLA